MLWDSRSNYMQFRSSTGSNRTDNIRESLATSSRTALWSVYNSSLGSRFPYKSSYLLKFLTLRADFAISMICSIQSFRMPDTHYITLQWVQDMNSVESTWLSTWQAADPVASAEKYSSNARAAGPPWPIWKQYPGGDFNFINFTYLSILNISWTFLEHFFGFS